MYYGSEKELKITLNLFAERYNIAYKTTTFSSVSSTDKFGLVKLTHGTHVNRQTDTKIRAFRLIFSSFNQDESLLL